MRRAAPVLVLALAVAALAGAASVTTHDGLDLAPAATSLEPTDVESKVAWYLGSQWDLRREEPTRSTPQRLASGNFYASWAQGHEQPTWRGSALDESLWVTGEVDLTFWVEADPAVVTTGPRDHGFPEYVVYFGTQESPIAVASVEGPDVKTAGDPVRIPASLPTPPGGMVLEEGAHPIAILAPVQAQDDRGPELDFLVNATSYASRVEATAQPVDLPDGSEVETRRLTGTLAGSAYAADQGPTAETHPLQVAEATTRVDLQLGSSGAGVRDIDLQVLGPDGGLVAQSVTPHPTEGIVLHPPTLDEVGPGDWTIRVVNYGHAAVEYAVEAGVSEG